MIFFSIVLEERQNVGNILAQEVSVHGFMGWDHGPQTGRPGIGPRLSLRLAPEIGWTVFHPGRGGFIFKSLISNYSIEQG